MPANIHKDKLRFVLHSFLSATEDEADCDECFEQLDKFVELVEAGRDAATLLPRIETHLNNCQCCYGEYEMLVSLVHNMKTSDDA